MTQQERELVWLAQKVKKDADMIERMEDYCDSHHQGWSKEVTGSFLDMILKKKDQMWYEEHRLELLAWKILEDRERKGEVPSREVMAVYNEVTNHSTTQ